MKKAIKSLSLVLALLLMLCLAACQTAEEADPWDDAVYLEDTTLGEGAKTVTVEVTAAEKTVVFTVRTDESTVGDALLALELIDGEEGQFGLYVKVVNGITADYDIDQTYWAFYVNGESSLTGVDMTALTDGATYRLAREK